MTFPSAKRPRCDRKCVTVGRTAKCQRGSADLTAAARTSGRVLQPQVRGARTKSVSSREESSRCTRLDSSLKS